MNATNPPPQTLMKPAEMDSACEIRVQVGDRGRVGTDRCSVRYIGEISGQKGEWVGVEWDDPRRGKHDGQTNGQRYFETQGGPTAGSFVRLDALEAGGTLVDALLERYKNRDMDQEEFDADMYVQATRNKTRKVELVGKTKAELRQSKTHLLICADLTEASVATVGDAEELETLVPNLEELDLSCNLVSSWLDAAKMVEWLPSIKLLNLSRNLFVIPKFQDCPTVTRLKSLVLNNCSINFGQILDLAACMPDLRRVQLCGNSIESLASNGDSDLNALNHIEDLDLENNKISSWEEIAKLGQLPNLVRLSLGRNAVSSVAYPSENDTDKPAFPALEILLMAGCDLKDRASIDAMDRFPKLKEVRVTKNPLTVEKKCSRYEIVARVAKLTFLNGATVSSSERVDCERRYLSQVAGALSLGKENDRDDILSSHPRYDDLVEVHGEICAISETFGAPQTLGDFMVELKLTCVAPSAGSKMGSHTKKIPLTLTIATLKMLAEKLFSVDAGKVKFFLKDKTMPMPEALEDDDRLQLRYLDLKDGQELVITAD
ncbi:hypothetical protein BSKO_01253 [Bryopsis sp. KO-2023]|nr:hypothetical protein BSKO_01253 [Bryopsis sp. KO-2023]